MKITRHIITALVGILSFTACEGMLDISSIFGPGGSGSEDVEVSVSLQNGTVSYEKSYQFVSVTASGEWTLDLQYPQETEDEWASLSTNSGKGSKDVVLTYSMNPGDSTRTLDVVLMYSGKEYRCTMSQNAARGGNTGGSTTNNGVRSTQCKWMELPATSEDDGFDWFHTDMTGPAGGTMRNYSYYWDYSNLVSHWVAYPLNKTLQGANNIRQDSWSADPNLPNDQQSIISNSGFKPYGFDRGHQCPSRDRCFSAEANLQTFHGTNATPQLSDFNQQIWSSFETLVRTWSNTCDTLYVVTGCVVAANSTNGKYGEVGGYANDNYGKRVAIPVGYYKAVLRYKKSQDYGYSGYCGCAVYLEHKDYGTNASITKNMSMSIDDLEKKIGIDLFVNLPFAIGEDNAAKVEAQNPQNVQIWW